MDLKRKKLQRCLWPLLLCSLVLAVTGVPVGAEHSVLKRGDSGYEVRLLQDWLRQLGYFAGECDGIFGSATEDAVRVFQKSNGLWVDGVAGDDTWERLSQLMARVEKQVPPGKPVAELLRLGDRSHEVALLQDWLYRLGFLSEPPDGLYGVSTEHAVREFQHEEGLAVDGIVGKETWEHLRQAIAATMTQYHVVKPGETLSEIALRYGASVQALAELNHLTSADYLVVGQRLLIGESLLVGGRTSQVELLPWDEVRFLFPNFSLAVVQDVQTGKQFRVRRYYGHFHADVEPLTRRDTEVMREMLGGEWSWDRRPIIVMRNGRRIAASMNGMPHGNGSIRDNGFDGHFCIHFLGSCLHLNGRPDIRHQSCVIQAAGYEIPERLWFPKDKP